MTLQAWLEEVGASISTLAGHVVLVAGVVLAEIAINILATWAEASKLLKPSVTENITWMTEHGIPVMLGVLTLVVLVCFTLQAYSSAVEQVHRFQLRRLDRQYELRSRENELKRNFESLIVPQPPQE